MNGSHVELPGKVKSPDMCTIPLPICDVSLSGFWDVGLLGPPLHHVTLAWLPSPLLQDQILPVRLDLLTPIMAPGPSLTHPASGCWSGFLLFGLLGNEKECQVAVEREPAVGVGWPFLLIRFTGKQKPWILLLK